MKSLLLQKAKSTLKNAYAPYSNFSVGASVLSTSGRIYTGCNVENKSFSLTCCAERVAIFNGVANGENRFKELLVIANTKKAITPCGACLQVMNEFLSSKSLIHVCNKREIVQTYRLEQLLPYTFNLE